MSNYINNKELYCELIISKATGNATRNLNKMLILIADNAILKFYYANPDDREDCYQQGLYDLIRNWHRFNEEKSSNAFAYLSEIFKRGCAQGFNKLYKMKGLGKNEKSPIIYSIDSLNDGKGMHNII